MSGLPENVPLRPLKWGRLLAGIIGGMVLMLVGLFAWDEKIKPYPDLILEAVPEPDPALNGVRYLEKVWTPRPKLSPTDSGALLWMIDGRKAWDEDLFARCHAGWENTLEELDYALALPYWHVPERSAAEDRPYSDYTDALPGLRQLNLMACAALHRGQPDRTLAIQNALERWSAQCAAGSTHAVYQGLPPLILSASANRLCDWLAADKATSADLGFFAEQWKDDRPSRDNIRTMWLPTAESIRDGLEDMRRGSWFKGLKLGNQQDPSGRLHFKHGKTVNSYHASLRWFIEHAADAAPSFEASPLTHFPDPSETVWTRWLDLNASGERELTWIQSNYFNDANQVILYPHFICRAMRVRIALERWKLAHSGTYPDQLKALVPGFLPAVPADPWNGQPLAWNAAAGIIYAAGSDWVTDLPTFKDNKGKPLQQWFANGYSSPGLRVTRPNNVP